MAATLTSLLLKFRTKNTAYGVTRDTVKVLARELELTETQVVHIALSKFAQEVLPAYELDDGPLSESQHKALKKYAAARLHTGRVISKTSMF